LYRTTAKLYIAILALSIVGCKSSTLQINAHTKRDFSFANGTWWIYQDSATGSTDSFAVLHFEDKNNSGCCKGNSVEEISDSVYLNGNPDSLSFIWALQASNNIIYQGYTFPTSKAVIIQFQVPFQNVTSTFISNEPTNDVFSITPLQSFQVNGTLFDTVAMIYHTDYDTTYNDWYYIASGVGIVKMEINHPNQKQTLNIVRYNIVR